MKSKRKLVAEKTPEAIAAEAAKIDVNAAYNEFAKVYRSLKENTKAWKEFLASEYQRCFGVPVPAEISWVLIRQKIAYHLQVVEGYQKAKIPVSAKMQQNYEAAQALDIEKFHKDTAGLLSVSMRHTDKTTKEDTMAKAKKVVKVSVKKGAAPAKAAKEKEPRITVSGIFAEIFAANFTKKLSDESIAKEVNVKSKGLGRGHQYAAKDIPAVRRKFNLGLLSGQDGKPKAALERFEAKK